MVLLNDAKQQPRRAVSFQGLNWIEEMERTKRGQEKRQQEKQARLVRLAAKYYKNKRKEALENAATVATAPDDTTLPFQNFLEFLSSPCNNTIDNGDDIRQKILDLQLCSATLSTFASSHNNSTSSGAMITPEAGSTQEDKIKLIHKLKSNMKDKTAPQLDIVAYYGGIVWMTQAKSNGLYDFNAASLTILPVSSAGDGNNNSNVNDLNVIRHQYQDGGGATETQNAASLVKGKTVMESTSNSAESENHEDNTGIVDPTIDVKNTHHQSSHHGSDNWLVCCAHSY